MIRIRALNRESFSDEEAPTIRREAQEEIVLEQYNIALRNQAKQNYSESIEILEKLIKENIPELENNGGLPKSMSSIKFSCHFNLGNNYLKLNNVYKALENYSTAAELDSSDVTLWCKIGKLSLKEDKFQKAAYAFSKGLECNESHWPCLDHLISVLYAIKDTITCLVYIGKALILDADYTKGLVLRKQIYADNPATKDYYQLYNPDYIWEPPLDIYIDKEDEKVVLEQAQKLCERVTEIEKSVGPKPLPAIPLPKPLEDYTWVSLANCIIGLHNYITENEMSHFTNIDLNRSMSQSSDCSIPKSEKSKSEKPLPKAETSNTEESKNEVAPSNEEKSNNSKNDSENISPEVQEGQKDVEEMQVVPPEVERRGSLASESNAEGQENGTPVQTDNDEEQVMEVDTENNDNETDGENQNTQRGRPKGTKRKRDVLSELQIWGWHSKRKQPKKVTKDYTVEDALNRIIPQSLLKSKISSQEILSAEDSMNTMDIYNMYVDDRELGFLSPIHSPKSVNFEAYFNTDREREDILQFWNRERDSVDAVTLIKELVFELAKIWHFKWPKDLVALYLTAYDMFREHCDPPQLFCSGIPFDKIREDALATLLFVELTTFSTENEKGIRPTVLGYLQLVSGFQDDWAEDFVSFFTRFYWLQAHIFRKRNENDLAINAFQMILEVAGEEEEKTKDKFTLNLPNCHKYGFVNKRFGEKIIKHLNMINALTSIESLYNAEKYNEVADIIKQTFTSASSFSKVGRMGRPAQLGLLLHSLWFTDLEDCFVWAEECLHESVENFRKPNSDQDKWEKVMDKCLGILHEIIKKETVTVVDLLNEEKRCRLVTTLSKIICYQLNSEFALTLPLGCVTPWILMHYILLREEQRQYASKRKTLSKRDQVDSQKEKDGKEDSSEENEEELPPSVAILCSAHEFLGPKGWCLTNKGELLLFILDTVLDRLDTPLFEPIKEKVEIHIEQALFCLYLYPSKKNKISRHLVDHNVNPIPLTWERSFQLYQYYGPDTIPEFNDLKSVSITGDLENLLRRIIALVPAINDLHAHLPKIMNYIHDKTNELPEPIDFPSKLRAIYYLIGDYHFKQGDVYKCIKYFQLDLCINPNRLDSWACLALSYSSQLEQKLNHCEDIKSDTDFLEKAKSAERCFQRALEISAEHLTLWIERGSFEYTVHSICSRMIKYDSENYNMEKFEILENEKESYLDSSGTSLQKAIAIYETEDNGEADERWLQYYILGKIAEKKKHEPMEYLQYYLTACNLLHENKATYPERINYNNPQHLSVEALEMHYRIHSSVLKYLELHEGKEIPNSLGAFFKRCIGITSEHFKPPAPPVTKSQSNDVDETTKEEIKNCVEEMLNKIERELDKTELHPEEENTDENKVVVIKEDKKEEDDDVVVIEDNDDDVIILDSDEETTKPDENEPKKEDKEEKVEEVLKKNEVVDEMEQSENSDQRDTENKEENSENKDENVGKDQPTDKNGALEEEKVEKVGETAKESDVCPMETEAIQEAIEAPNITDVQSVLDKMMEETMKEAKLMEDTNNSSFEQVEEVVLPVEDNQEKGHVRSKEEESVDSPEKSKTGNTAETDTETVKNSATENDSSSTSSSSSSSSDSSSSDSDDESSSSESSSSENESREHMSNSEILQLVDKCIHGLEACCLRLEGNYKALYRLAHVFFNYKNRKDYTKCKQILLGEYKTKDGKNIQGLFFERKMSNFFNGIWRIPCTEIDRPGSLAAHMNRCISLLLQVLRNTNDNKTLVELCLQLKKEPDRDKIYIKNSDRLAFSEQAMNMCLQSFRGQIKNMANMSNTQMIKLLHDIFRVYQKVQKHFSSKEGLISSLLVDAYKSFIKEKIHDNVNVLDLAIKFCQQYKPLEKHRNSSAHTSFVSRSPGMGTSPVLPAPSTLGQQNSGKKHFVSRPRGRPPLPKVPGQLKPPKSKNPAVSAANLGTYGARSNQNFTYEYLKQYQEQLIKQYSQNLTYSQMAQLSQMMAQGQLNNPAMASAVTNQFLAGTGLLPPTASTGLLPNVSTSSMVGNTVPTSTSVLDNQSLISSVFKSGIGPSSLSGMTVEQLAYLEAIIKNSKQISNKNILSSKSNQYKKPSTSNKLPKESTTASSKKTNENKTPNVLMKERPSISITPVASVPTSTHTSSSLKTSSKQDFTITPSAATFSKSNTIASTATFTKTSSTLYSTSKSSTTVTTASSTKSSTSTGSYPKASSLVGVNPLNFLATSTANILKSTASSMPYGIPSMNFEMPNIGATITPSNNAFSKQKIPSSPKTTRASVVVSPSARSAMTVSPSTSQYGSPSGLSKPTSTSPGKTLQEKLAEKKKEQNKQMHQNSQGHSSSAALLKSLNLPSLPTNLSVSRSAGATSYPPSTLSQAEIRSGAYPAFGIEKNLSMPKSVGQMGTNAGKTSFGTDALGASTSQVAAKESKKPLFKENPPKGHSSPTSKPISLTNEVEITLSPQSTKVSSKSESISPKSSVKPLISVKKDLFAKTSEGKKDNFSSKSSNADVDCAGVIKYKPKLKSSQMSAAEIDRILKDFKSKPQSSSSGSSSYKSVPKTSSNLNEMQKKSSSSDIVRNSSVIQTTSKSSSEAKKGSEAQEALKSLKNLSGLHISVNPPSTSKNGKETNLPQDEPKSDNKEDIICIDD